VMVPLLVSKVASFIGGQMTEDGGRKETIRNLVNGGTFRLYLPSSVLPLYRLRGGDVAVNW
jgi:hypothetical protein